MRRKDKKGEGTVKTVLAEGKKAGLLLVIRKIGDQGLRRW